MSTPKDRPEGRGGAMWLRFHRGRVWHQVRGVHRVGTGGWVSLPTVCRASADAIANVVTSRPLGSLCKGCDRAHASSVPGGES